eukprot:COSAG01_NODE_2470_length_7633_cov_17.854468_9_plen_72_part_00
MKCVLAFDVVQSVQATQAFCTVCCLLNLPRASCIDSPDADIRETWSLESQKQPNQILPSQPAHRQPSLAYK